MFTINTYLDRSAVHGIGVFAGEDIPGGHVIWTFHPDVDLEFSEDRWQEMEQNVCGPSFCMLKRYAYKEEGKFYLCLDNAQFMNHDAEHFNVANHKTGNVMTARHTIKKGEELLCNYFEYSDTDDPHIVHIQSA